jgi:PIN domain nuclease of toxin-antitoxin system
VRPAVPHRRRSGGQLWSAASRPNYDGPLLLDTHIWLWMLDDDMGHLAVAVPRLLARAAATGQLLVCDISYWELATKAAKGRLPLSMDVAIWLRRAEAAPGVRPVPVDRELLVMSTRLPGTLHGDPADRILLAAAQLLAAPLVTIDERIIDYATVQRGVPVCDARP